MDAYWSNGLDHKYGG
jgi:DCN1-like protein 1/2